MPVPGLRLRCVAIPLSARARSRGARGLEEAYRRADDRPVDPHVPPELVLAAAVLIILVEPLVAGPGRRFQSKHRELVADQPHAGIGEFGSDAEAAEIAVQQELPVIGEIDQDAPAD